MCLARVDPDGPEGPLPPMLVTIPPGVVAGQQMQVQIPPPAAAVPVVTPVAPVAVVAAPGQAAATPDFSTE